MNTDAHNGATKVPERMFARSCSPNLDAAVFAAADHANRRLRDACHVTVMRLLDAGGEGARGGVERADGAALAADCETGSSDGQTHLLRQKSDGESKEGVKRHNMLQKCTGGRVRAQGARTIGDFSLSAATPLPALKLARASGVVKPSGTTFFLRCCSSSTPISLILVLISMLMPG
jgi:hypothetical protein